MPPGVVDAASATGHGLGAVRAQPALQLCPFQVRATVTRSTVTSAGGGSDSPSARRQAIAPSSASLTFAFGLLERAPLTYGLGHFGDLRTDPAIFAGGENGGVRDGLARTDTGRK